MRLGPVRYIKGAADGRKSLHLRLSGPKIYSQPEGLDVSTLEKVQQQLSEGDVQVEHIYLGDRKLSVRTSVLEEKATACTMLCCYADELKEGFYPYVEQVFILA